MYSPVDPQIKITSPNCVSPDTNGSQFFITTAATPHLNGKHILFGRVIQGENVVKAIEAQGTQSGKPLKRVTIKDSGILEA
jgi:peptidylprolyl isomerase